MRSQPPFLKTLSAVAGVKPKILAWSPTQGEYQNIVVALAFLALEDHCGEWSFLGWETIDQGRWNPKTAVLSFTTASNLDFEVVLSKVGDLPAAFQERVNASIVFTRQFDLFEGSATISKRRSLAAGDDAGHWRIVTKGVSPDHPDIQAQYKRLRREYD